LLAAAPGLKIRSVFQGRIIIEICAIACYDNFTLLQFHISGANIMAPWQAGLVSACLFLNVKKTRNSC